jgi:hypothetical protein
VATDVLAQREQLALWREQAGRMEATGLVEGTLGGTQEIRQSQDHRPRNDRALGEWLDAEGDLVDRGLAADPARRRSDEVPFGELESRLRESRDEKVSLDETTLMSLTAAIERAAADFSRNSDDPEKLENWAKLVSIVRDAGVDVDLRRPQNDYYRLKKSVRPVIAATAGNGSSSANRWLQHFDALGEKLSISPEARG